MKHRMKCYICKLIERRLTPDQVRSATPATYGDVITFDHLNFLFDAQYDAMRPYSYLDLVGEALHWLLTVPARKITVVDLAEQNQEVRNELYL